MAINLNYPGRESMVISNINDFFGQGLPETQKLKDLFNSIKVTFKVQDSDVVISFIEGRIYKFDITKSRKRIQIGAIYYLFPNSEIHFYNYGDEAPFLVVKKRKVIQSQVQGMIGSVDYSPIFSRIINAV